MEYLQKVNVVIKSEKVVGGIHDVETNDVRNNRMRKRGVKSTIVSAKSAAISPSATKRRVAPKRQLPLNSTRGKKKSRGGGGSEKDSRNEVVNDVSGRSGVIVNNANLVNDGWKQARRGDFKGKSE